MQKQFIILSLFFITSNKILAQADTPVQSYPQIKIYVSVIHPIVTFDKDGHTFNFSKGYTVIFPIGINYYKNDKIGFSFEMAPSVRVAKDTSKVNNMVFHPGIIFRCKRGYSFVTRVAFETTGRYGFTPVLGKTIIKKDNVNYFVTIATPVRVGNAKPASVGLAFQFGILF